MAENKQDIFNRAYTMLLSLRETIAQMSSPIPEKYVHEFHTALDKLESIGIDVSEFRIPDSEVKPRTIASAYVNGKKMWSTEVIGVEQSFILYRLDRTLKYLEIITSEKPGKMGFRTPHNE